VIFFLLPLLFLPQDYFLPFVLLYYIINLAIFVWMKLIPLPQSWIAVDKTKLIGGSI